MPLPSIVPVLPTSDMARDIQWYQQKVGFTPAFGDKMYAGMVRGDLEIHFQWHAGTEEDPVNGGSVIKIFVEDVQPFFDELVDRGTVPPEKLQKNTPWGTHEFGFYDLNKNAIFVVQDI